jgi:FKBP-type peptidyl-prolyl cis-trans isomerase FkpA
MSAPLLRLSAVLLLVFPAALAASPSPGGRVRDDVVLALVTTRSGLKYEDLRRGGGATAARGATIELHYVGTLSDGTKFDSSRDRNQPFRFVLGRGAVIKGFDEGITGMRVGGRRRLVIPPALGYGGRGVGVIPPNATLIFDVELLDVR